MIGIVNDLEMFRREHQKTGTEKPINMGLVPAIVWGLMALDMRPTQRQKMRRQVAEMLDKKKHASLDIILEVENVELEYELAFAATSYWAKLMTCMKPGRSRSSAQVPGMGFGSWRERSAASSGTRACNGQRGTRLRMEKLCWNAVWLLRATFKQLKCLGGRKHIDEMENGVWFEARIFLEGSAMKSGLKKRKICEALGWTMERSPKAPCVECKLCGGPGTQKKKVVPQ